MATLSRGLPPSWGILYLGHCLELNRPCDWEGLDLDQDGAGERVSILKVAPEMPVLTTHAYSVAGDCLETLIDWLDRCGSSPSGSALKGPQSFDGALSLFRKRNPELVTLALNPSAAYQRKSASDHSSRVFDRIPGIRALVGAGRRFKSACQSS